MTSQLLASNEKDHAKRLDFIERFLATNNIRQSAAAAGYSTRSAAAIGCEILDDPRVQAELHRRRKSLEMRSGIDLVETLCRLALIARGDPTEVFDDDGNLLHPKRWPAHVKAQVQSIEVVTRRTGGVDDEGNAVVERVHKVRFEPRTPALGMIMRHLGGFDGKRADDGTDDTAKPPQLSDIELAKRIIYGLECAKLQLEQQRAAEAQTA